MTQCEDCGGDSVNHTLQYAGVVLDTLLGRFTSFVPRFYTGSSFFRTFSLLSRAGLGSMLTEPDEKTLLLDTVLWHEAQRRGISMCEFRPFNSVQNTFVARLPSGTLIDFDGIPVLGKKPVWWTNNKSLLRKNLHAQSLPAPKGGLALSYKKARMLFHQLPKPVIVKPAVGSASRHTSMHVETAEDLQRAFVSARAVSPLVEIEEELPGDVYRATLVGGKLIATLRRDQPQVVGDGISTIEELVSAENMHPARQGPYFSKITIDAAALKELAFQHLTQKSVPKEGRRVRLHQKINWSVGGTTADVSDEVHPENRALFERVAEILNAPLLGIDVIAEDISRPWHEQRAGIIECNDMPYFDNHHLPFTGTPRDIAGPVWDLIESTYS